MSKASSTAADAGMAVAGHPVVLTDREWRRVKSSRPVVVDARLTIGRELRLRQRPHPIDRDATVSSRSARRRRVGTFPGVPTEWTLEPTDRPIAIADDGCSTSFGIIGAPGSGKTHLMRRLLRDIVNHAPGCPAQQFGGLILDPKGSMIDDVGRMLAGHPRESDLIVIDGSSGQRPVNVIACAQSARELARLLVLAAQSSGVSAKEPFWFMAWTNLFAAAMTLLEIADHGRLTLDRIVRSVMSKDADGKRQIERLADAMVKDAAVVAMSYAALDRRRTAAAVETDIHQATGDIHSFYSARADY